MIGLFETHQIVIAQLQPEVSEVKVYEEIWYLRLNVQTDFLVPVYLKGFCQAIDMEIGTQGTVSFGKIQPGCHQEVLVDMKNKTLHSLR